MQTAMIGDSMGKIGTMVAAAGLLATSMTACGSSSRTATQIVTGANASTLSSKTAHFSGTVTVAGKTISFDGTLDLGKRIGQFTESLPNIGKVEVLQDGLIAYAKLPDAAAAALGGKPWVKVDAAALSQKVTGVDVSSLVGNRNGPVEGIGWLNGAGRDFHRVGTEVVRGVTTTHYDGGVDLTKAAAAEADPGRRQALRQEAKLLGVPSMAMSVWIDGSGRLAQMHYSIDLSKMQLPSGPSRSSGTIDTTFALFDFGTPFTMPALPAADQTSDLSQVLGAQAAAAAAGSGASTTVTAVQSAAVAAQLRKLLIAPSGFAPSTAAGVTNGPVDTAAFDKNFGTTGLAAKFGLIGGYDVSFVQKAGTDRVEVTLFEFTSPAKAAAVSQFFVSTAKVVDSSQTAYADVPGAVAVNATTTAADGTFEHDIFATKANRVMVVAYTTSTAGTVAGLGPIAVKQYGAL